MDFLRAIDEQKALRAFRVEDELASALLEDPAGHALLSVNRLSLGCFEGSLPTDRIASITETAVRIIQPKGLQVYCLFQHLLDLSKLGDYERVKSLAGATWFQRPAQGFGRLTDFAMTMDGRIKDDSGSWVYTNSFGIVDDEEVGSRIAQSYADIDGVSTGHGITPNELECVERAENYPAVGLYVNSKWHLHGQLEPDNVAGCATDTYSAALVKADDFVSALYEQLMAAAPSTRPRATRSKSRSGR